MIKGLMNTSEYSLTFREYLVSSVFVVFPILDGEDGSCYLCEIAYIFSGE